MTRLHELHDQAGQSPWLDNLRRDWIASGELAQWVADGVRGLTSNPSIFEKAIGGSSAYDPEFASLIAGGATVEESYWQLVRTDIAGALSILEPVHVSSGGIDGYVSVEVDPGLARDTQGTIAAARALAEAIAADNLYVKIPGTEEGLPAIEQMIAEHRSINVTLLFSIERYGEVMEAYLAGLERAEGDLSTVSSVASFFISRVDSAVDARLGAIGSVEAAALVGKTAIAQAMLAYELHQSTFSGPRWDALVARGARPQRPLWASTSTKNPAFADTLYVDSLIGPGTVNTLPDATIKAFMDHGTVARTIDADVTEARAIIERVRSLGVDLDEVAASLEAEGVASFEKAFDDLLATLETKASLLKSSS